MSKRPVKVKLKFKTLYDAVMAGTVKPFKGEKDSYIELAVWVNSEKDDYGRYGSVSVDNSYVEGDQKVYVGDVKSNPFVEEPAAPNAPQAAPAVADTDLPF